MIDFRRVATIAALVASSMPALGAEVMPNPQRDYRPSTFSREKYRGKHKPAGSKLLRKAKEGKL